MINPIYFREYSKNITSSSLHKVIMNIRESKIIPIFVSVTLKVIDYA